MVLESGGIALDIPRVEARAFVVSAANHQITVLGTAFRVRIEPRPDREVLHVDVTRGTVQVARDDGSSRRVLGSGETWSTTVEPGLAPTASAPVIELPPSAAPPPRPAATVDGPKELLARATDARAQGRSKDAAAAFDQLRKRYRNDPRAGLAALELGRIRLDALGDAAGALEALDDALAIAPGAPLREDAEARRVDALDALSDPRCAAARTSYLGRYPQGVHAKTVRLRCTQR
ncbi:tetratricopeptide repeat protein [Pendulispora rubella]|uniref:Tetratricopeptide repeat protein n=1 Tax=Pendulispora rubella TaxID=2741070 RepID=A0ABZ2L9H8_9BACT